MNDLGTDIRFLEYELTRLTPRPVSKLKGSEWRALIFRYDLAQQSALVSLTSSQLQN